MLHLTNIPLLLPPTDKYVSLLLQNECEWSQGCGISLGLSTSCPSTSCPWQLVQDENTLPVRKAAQHLRMESPVGKDGTLVFYKWFLFFVCLGDTLCFVVPEGCLLRQDWPHSTGWLLLLFWDIHSQCDKMNTLVKLHSVWPYSGDYHVWKICWFTHGRPFTYHLHAMYVHLHAW